MEVSVAKNLGKRRKVGETFITTTKTMSKKRYSQTKRENTYEVLKQGEKRMFTKGKRQYYCEVLGMCEFRTGLYIGSIREPKHYINNRMHGMRWWQFSYLVLILEN
jgi:hypothetical protein